MCKQDYLCATGQPEEIDWKSPAWDNELRSEVVTVLLIYLHVDGIRQIHFNDASCDSQIGLIDIINRVPKEPAACFRCALSINARIDIWISLWVFCIYLWRLTSCFPSFLVIFQNHERQLYRCSVAFCKRICNAHIAM